MFSTAKISMISLSLVCTIFLGYPVFAMDDRERNLEVTHQARLAEAYPDQKEQQSDIPSTLGRHVSRHPSANKSSHAPKYTPIDDLDSLVLQASNNPTKNNSH